MPGFVVVNLTLNPSPKGKGNHTQPPLFKVVAKDQPFFLCAFSKRKRSLLNTDGKKQP
jgi:hypothetical protein